MLMPAGGHLKHSCLTDLTIGHYGFFIARAVMSFWLRIRVESFGLDGFLPDKVDLRDSWIIPWHWHSYLGMIREDFSFSIFHLFDQVGIRFRLKPLAITCHIRLQGIFHTNSWVCKEDVALGYKVFFMYVVAMQPLKWRTNLLWKPVISVEISSSWDLLQLSLSNNFSVCHFTLPGRNGINLFVYFSRNYSFICCTSKILDFFESKSLIMTDSEAWNVCALTMAVWRRQVEHLRWV